MSKRIPCSKGLAGVIILFATCVVDTAQAQRTGALCTLCEGAHATGTVQAAVLDLECACAGCMRRTSCQLCYPKLIKSILQAVGAMTEMAQTSPAILLEALQQTTTSASLSMCGAVWLLFLDTEHLPTWCLPGEHCKCLRCTCVATVHLHHMISGRAHVCCTTFQWRLHLALGST